MKIKNDTLYVTSEDDFYVYERAGNKPNTTRIVTQEEYNNLVRADPKVICVELAGSDSNTYFKRDIKDISQIGKLLGKIFVTISWHPFYFHQESET